MYNVEALKAEILESGGLIITDRGVGKTHAMVSILRDDPDTILVVPFPVNKSHALSLYYKNYHIKTDRVYTNAEYWQSREEGRFNTVRILVDEYFQHERLIHSFYIAITSETFPIKLLTLPSESGSATLTYNFKDNKYVS